VDDADGTGGADPRKGAGLDLLLLALVVLLLVAVVLGAVLLRDARERDATAAADQERYAAVLAAARAEADAVVNVRHDDGGASIDAVAQGATGRLRERYTTGRDAVLRELRRERSVAEGEVSEVGVVALGSTTATAVAATDGTLASRRSDGRPVARDARLRLELVLEDGRWLTSDVQVLD
jgi:Mce-associated membrane protein